ncbi:MAG: hypothetical protein WCA35_20030 [Kovacikia sp.]
MPSHKKRRTKSQEDLPNLEFVDGQRLSSHLIDLIDVLTDAQKDWICLLNPDWEVDLRTFNLVNAGTNTLLSKITVRRIGEIVLSTRQAQVQPMMIAQQMCWTYACCLQIKGLGRVRVVIDFDSSQLTDNPVIFATNRLDWSSRRVLTQWFQRRPPLSTGNKENPPELLIEVFCQY